MDGEGKESAEAKLVFLNKFSSEFSNDFDTNRNILAGREIGCAFC